MHAFESQTHYLECLDWNLNSIHFASIYTYLKPRVFLQRENSISLINTFLTCRHMCKPIQRMYVLTLPWLFFFFIFPSKISISIFTLNSKQNLLCLTWASWMCSVKVHACQHLPCSGTVDHKLWPHHFSSYTIRFHNLRALSLPRRTPSYSEIVILFTNFKIKHTERLLYNKGLVILYLEPNKISILIHIITFCDDCLFHFSMVNQITLYNLIFVSSTLLFL